MVGQEYGFYVGQPTVGVMLWDGTNASTESLIGDLQRFCKLRGAEVINAHARASLVGGMSPRIELTIRYPRDGDLGGLYQDYTLQRWDALILFSVHEKIRHIQVIAEDAARQIVDVGPETIVIGVDPGPDGAVVVAEALSDGKFRILGAS